MGVPTRWRNRRHDDHEVASWDRRAVRQAAWLFVAAGTIGLITDFMPGTVGPGDKWLDALNLVTGLVALTRLSKWWTGYRALVFPVFGMVVIGLNNVAGALPEPTLGIWFVLMFLWVGLWYPRRTCLLLSPLAAGAYLFPYAFGAPRTTGAVGSVVLVIPVAVLAGELIAANVARTRQFAREQQRAVDALAKANLTDDLTQLGNRRLGNQILDGIEPGDAVALLDLDHFKAVNDQYGHARGDAVLQQIGDYLRAVVRSEDGIARMGGQEFMVILHRITPGQAFDSIDRLITGWRSTAPLSTLSAGVAMHVAGRSPIGTYRDADDALYAAKATGRDRTALHDAPDPASLVAERLDASATGSGRST